MGTAAVLGVYFKSNKTFIYVMIITLTKHLAT